MSYDFAGYPELGIALPFKNLSFQKWTGDLPENWEEDGTPNGSRVPGEGFDLTRGLKIEGSGVITTGNATQLYQEIALPDRPDNGQKVRLRLAYKTDLGGAYGDSRAVVYVYQGATTLIDFSDIEEDYWALGELDSDHTSNHINTGTATIGLMLFVRSNGSSSDPAALFDCIVVEYGRATSEKYYTLTEYPLLSGVKMEAISFGKNERLPSGPLRFYDVSGGNAKWRITLPFVDISASTAEALSDFFKINKGLDGSPATPLVLHHKLLNTAAGHTDGDNYLGRPPWIICNITNEVNPLMESGDWADAELFSGTFVFEEI